MTQFSISYLLLGIAICGLAAATIFADLPSSVNLLIGIGATIAIVFLFVKTKSIVVASVLSLPLLCILNWSLFIIAIGHAFGSPGATETIVGPVAKILAWPVVAIQNAVPMTRPWDTVTGVIVVSLSEMFGIVATALAIRTRREFG